MSVDTQIERIKTNISNVYASAEAKGATIPEVKNSDNLASCVDSITTGGGGSQFGLTVEQILGTLDSEGNLVLPTLPSITFTGVKNITDYTFRYKFNGRSFETGANISFPDLTNVMSNGLSYCFQNSTGLVSVDLSALTTINGAYGLYSCFYGCSSLTSVDLSALISVDEYSLYSCFYGCSSLTSVDLSALTTVNAYGLSSCFYSCSSLTTISFSSLISVQTNSFGSASYNYCFYGCAALTEIHFRADAQTAIEAMTGYADKWGAANATIYFDL